MAIKTAEKEIDGKTLKIVLVGSLEGMQITAQLSKVALPTILALQDDQASMADIAAAALTNLDHIDYVKIIKRLFDGATVDDFPIKPDDYFAGNYGELVSFLTFAITANFGSFFAQGGLSDLITSNLNS